MITVTQCYRKGIGRYPETYDKLVKGLIDVTISTAAGLERFSYPANIDFA
jgi:hypothetical protein